MGYYEKINIYVPENIGRVIENDASLFEVFKRNGKSINKNRFLSMLIKGYYNTYQAESQNIFGTIIEIIDGLYAESSKNEKAATSIVNTIFRTEVPTRKGKNPAKLSLKPTTETETLINHIMDDLDDNDYISQYLCRMFMSYCEKPFSVREQILFKENYEFLDNAIQTGKGIMFNTIWDSRKNHYVYPYKIVVGQEEMFNYLLCCERDEKTGALQARSYRLNRITRLNYSTKIIIIPEHVTDNLEMMIKYGPQFAINDDEESCVKLTSRGVISFNRIYYGRPQYDRIEECEDGSYYYFNCSEDQVYLYFKRFEGNAAEIISPEKLRKRMERFHADGLRTYERGVE